MLKNKHDAYIQYINHISNRSEFYENIQTLTQMTAIDNFDIDFTRRTDSKPFIYFYRLRPIYKNKNWIFILPRRLKIKLGIYVKPSTNSITIIFENNKRFIFDNSYFDKDDDTIFQNEKYINTNTLSLNVAKFDILSQIKIETKNPNPILIKCIELNLNELVKFIYIDSPIHDKIYTSYKLCNVDDIEENCGCYFLFIKEECRDVEKDLIYFLTYHFHNYIYVRKFYIYDEDILNFYKIKETSLYLSKKLTCDFDKNECTKLDLPLYFEMI